MRALVLVALAAPLFIGCQMVPGMAGLTIQHTKVVNASSVPLCKVEIVHSSGAGAGKNALNPVDVPLQPGSEKSAEVPRLAEGTPAGTWEARGYTCRTNSSDPDAMLAKIDIPDANQKIVLH